MPGVWGGLVGERIEGGEGGGEEISDTQREMEKCFIGNGHEIEIMGWKL